MTNYYFDPTLQDSQSLDFGQYLPRYNQSLRRGQMYGGQYNQNLNRVNFYQPNFYPVTGNENKSDEDKTKGLSTFLGGVGLGLNAVNTSNQRLNLTQQIAPSQYDAFSAPVYTAGAAQNEASTARINGVNGGDVANSAVQGAIAGSEFGPTGTAVGALYGATTSILGGASRADAQKRQRSLALQRVAKAQQLYNQQDVAFRRGQNQYNEYLQRQNPYGREYNIYRSRFNY